MKTNGSLTVRVRSALLAGAVLFGFGIIGCVDSKTESQPNNAASSSPVKSGDPKELAKKDDGHMLDDYWCAPHGLPEEECWKCNPEFRDKCKKDGDWCEEHLRPQSQCFKCDPKKIDEWAKKYKERTGKDAPKPRNY